MFQSTLPVRGATHETDRFNSWADVSIHAPRAGSDLDSDEYATQPFKFQSTLPVRGATLRFHTVSNDKERFNPRSPCGERRALWSGLSGTMLFQSTLPVRGAT